MLYDPTQNEKDTLNKVEESLANASQDNLDDLLAKLHRPENDMGFEKELYEKKDRLPTSKKVVVDNFLRN